MKWTPVQALEIGGPVVVVSDDGWRAMLDAVELLRYERDELRDALAYSRRAVDMMHADGVRAEREACAQLVESMPWEMGAHPDSQLSQRLRQIAEAIRARGDK